MTGQKRYGAKHLLRIVTFLLCATLPIKRWRRGLRWYYAKKNILDEVHRKFNRSLGYKLNLENPKTFNEKIQWFKLYYRNRKMTMCADKYSVRRYYKEKNLESHVVGLLGVWDNVEEINWESLPKQFVLKANHTAGDVWIIKDKDMIDTQQLKRELSIALKKRFGERGAEFHYLFIPPKIIAEQYLEDASGGLLDYKIYCFQGKAHYIQVDFDRSFDHRYAIYDRNWAKTSCSDTAKTVKKPEKLTDMIVIAERLSAEFPHVRIDLYYVDTSIYLGEMTFSTGSGFIPFTPTSWDEVFGNCWDLKAISRKHLRSAPCLSAADYYS